MAKRSRSESNVCYYTKRSCVYYGPCLMTTVDVLRRLPDPTAAEASYLQSIDSIIEEGNVHTIYRLFRQLPGDKEKVAFLLSYYLRYCVFPPDFAAFDIFTPTNTNIVTHGVLLGNVAFWSALLHQDTATADLLLNRRLFSWFHKSAPFSPPTGVIGPTGPTYRMVVLQRIADLWAQAGCPPFSSTPDTLVSRSKNFHDMYMSEDILRFTNSINLFKLLFVKSSYRHCSNFEEFKKEFYSFVKFSEGSDDDLKYICDVVDYLASNRSLYSFFHLDFVWEVIRRNHYAEECMYELVCNLSYEAMIKRMMPLYTLVARVTSAGRYSSHDIQQTLERDLKHDTFCKVGDEVDAIAMKRYDPFFKFDFGLRGTWVHLTCANAYDFVPVDEM